MRILYVVHQFYPESSAGTERFLLNIAKGMQRTGHHVEVATYSMGDASGFEHAGSVLARTYLYKRIRVTAMRHSKLSIEINTSITDPKIASFAREHLSKGKYDLVHVVHPMRMTDFGSEAGKMNIPYVVTLTDFWTLCPKVILETSYGILCTGPEGGVACRELCPELSNAWVRTRLCGLHTMLSGAAAVIAPSQFAASLIRKEFPDLPLIVIPHGLPANTFPAREKYYDDEATINFGYCGGLAPHKGVHLLISAFRSLEETRAVLKIYGTSKPDEQAYCDHLREIAAGDDRIVFCGSYDPEESGRVFDSLDVVVVPSLAYETYSFALHEAFAAGVPVIVSRVGALIEEIKDGENGFSFAAGDQAELTVKLKMVFESPAILNSMRENLKALALPLEEEEAYSYERIYRKATTRSRREAV
jgi:glycosyltransferase involved in cell wall biosynthesis